MIDAKQIDDLSLEELWSLYEAIRQLLPEKLKHQAKGLQTRLAALAEEANSLEQLEKRASATSTVKEPVGLKRRRPEPKYRNPGQPYETWTGRGKCPRWLVAQLRRGRSMDEFLIVQSEESVKTAMEKTG